MPIQANGVEMSKAGKTVSHEALVTQTTKVLGPDTSVTQSTCDLVKGGGKKFEWKQPKERLAEVSGNLETTLAVTGALCLPLMVLHEYPYGTQ